MTHQYCDIVGEMRFEEECVFCLHEVLPVLISRKIEWFKLST